MNSRNSNVVKYRKRKKIHLSSIIFIFIFIYILIIIVSFLSKKQISIYEVVEKEIADDDTCQGIIIRDEQVYTNKDTGYISFYVRDGEKVAKSSVVYAIDESGEIYDMLSSSKDTKNLTGADNIKIRNYIGSYQRNFNYSTFDKVQDFNYKIEKTVLSYTHLALSDVMQNLSENEDRTDRLLIVKADKPGIFCSIIDGFEDVSADAVTTKTFEQENESKMIVGNKEIEKGTNIYKLITNENWSIVLNLTKEQYKKLYKKEQEAKKNKTTSVVQIKFADQQLDAVVPFELLTRENGYFAKLTMDKYMGNFINDRFINIQFVIHSAEGLKIPKSAVLTKKFFEVPVTYFTLGGNDNQRGLVKQLVSEDGTITYKFVKPKIVLQTDDYVCMSSDSLKTGDIIKNVDNQQTYSIGKIKEIKGVYNVNKGYCVFRQIEVQYDNNEYMIVKKDTYNGLRNYDHILLDVLEMEENELMK